MAYAFVEVRLGYIIGGRHVERFIEGYEESLTFTVAIRDVSSGVANAALPAATNAKNVLGLAKVEIDDELRGYVLHRLRDLKQFDYEDGQAGLRVERAQLTLTWLDPTGHEEPFVVVYNLRPGDHSVVETISNHSATFAWELLVKRTGDSPANFRYFLRRIVPGGAGDDAITECAQLKAELDHIRETEPKNKRAIREARRRYLWHPCPPP